MVKFSMDCYNPHFDVEIADKGIDSRGIGLAVSQVVQFNINQHATSDRIVFVDQNNFGVANVKLDGRYRIIGGTGEIDPVNISGSPAAAVRNAVRISLTHATETYATFIVEPLTALTGTINVTFFVQYVKVLPSA